MEKYTLSLKDINSNYFHFTWKSNLDSIEQNGLIPKKGEHAKYIEETKKVFFVQGLDNLLILFDCWINVYKKIPLVPQSRIAHNLGSKAMCSKKFPMFLVDFYFLLIKKSKRHKKYAYNMFSELLNETVLLNLDIKEENEFSFSDIDEIKARGYRKRHLIELGYSEKYSDMKSCKMDSWNLHTQSEKGITPNKIKLCFINNSCNMREILCYVLKNSKFDLKDMCPVLYDYLDKNPLS